MRALALVAALTALSACATAPAPNAPLVGAWRLVSYVDTPQGGAPVYAFGEHPDGLFVFSADGHAAFNITRSPPGAALSVDPDPDTCMPDWYCSYFGSYTVAPDGRSWTMHVEGGNIRSFIGTDQTRPFTIEGDTLIVAGAYDDANGNPVRFERRLQRQH